METLTRTYTYTGQASWKAGNSAVPLSSFAISGSTRPITKILSIEAKWYRYQDTSSTITHTAELAFSNGTALVSNESKYRHDGGKYYITGAFSALPAADTWIESAITLRTTVLPTSKIDHVKWQATADYPMVVTITYESTTFIPTIADAKIYRADSDGSAADDGSNLSFSATVLVKDAGSNGSGTLTVYKVNDDGTRTAIYTQSVTTSLTGTTVSQAPISGVTAPTGEKRYYQIEYAYTATTNAGITSTETATATMLVGEVFTNVHLAGVSTGGVRFGGYSTATQNSPKFECDYPIYSYAGIMNIVGGRTAQISVPANGYVDVGINWGITFKQLPQVSICLESDSTAGAFGHVAATIYPGTVGLTGCTARVFNADSTARKPYIRWIAYGVL